MNPLEGHFLDARVIETDDLKIMLKMQIKLLEFQVFFEDSLNGSSEGLFVELRKMKAFWNGVVILGL